MFVDLDGFTLHLRASGPQDAPVVLLLHSLGTDHGVWDPQAEALERDHRVLRPDLRGHGLSGVTPGPYSIAGLADDIAGLLERLEVTRAHVAGLSIGGMVAQALAARAPQRVASLVLCDTALAIPPASLWRDRAALVRREGMAAIADAVLARWVTPAAIDTPETRGLKAMLLRTAPEGYAGAAEALAVADLSSSAGALRVPTLVLVGEADLATPLASAQALAGAIPGARLAVIPAASHIPTFEQAAAVNQHLTTFLTPQADGLARPSVMARGSG